jgi:hypothetical protein
MYFLQRLILTGKIFCFTTIHFKLCIEKFLIKLKEKINKFGFHIIRHIFVVNKNIIIKIYIKIKLNLINSCIISNLNL